MCGIAGAFGGRATGEARSRAVERISAAICHRGPDDAGSCELRGRKDGGAAGTFAHRRLSILDLSPQGHQPMFDASARLSIVFNGEIYNYRELRAELAASGATFRSGSDTEVLLEGWARHGELFLPRLRGMFAFAIWDADAGCGYLARDRFGIKPLYLAETAEGLFFASEVRGLLATGCVRRVIDRAAVGGYLAQGSVPEPLTALSGVRALPAGCVVTVAVDAERATAGEPRRFAETLRTPATPPETNRARAATMVRTALENSVAHHLVSDVPVALFLSGGIDSSAIVALASRASDRPLRTFTITFAERGYSEAGPAAAVARRYHTEHAEVLLRGADVLAALPTALGAMDQPSLDGVNTFAVSSAVRRAGYKVVLSGLGGDELFAGYPDFRRAQRIAALWGGGAVLRAPARALAALVARGGDGRAGKIALSLAAGEPARAAYVASRALFAGGALSALAGRESASEAWAAGLPTPPTGLSLLQRVSWYELSGYMRNTLLRDSDVFSMAHALELRVPFIDDAVAAASMSVDDTLKLDPGRSKPLLLDAVADLLPREVWDRPKQGFELPFARWLREELRPEVHAALTSADRLARVGLDAAAVRAVWEGFLAARPGLSWSRPWALFTLVRWAEEQDVSVADADVGMALRSGVSPRARVPSAAGLAT
ncbi:MAG TPA: asparagine synthase (glutamine-hydrolyzing) [Gemmatimonadaceae bacterium]|nr:asparagine synthase (glutamine-hydrolyzing) [Gemmatimonadaceae bacterium]